MCDVALAVMNEGEFSVSCMFPKGSGFLITSMYHIFSLLTLLSYFYSQTRDAKTSFAKRLNDIKVLERSIVTL